MRFPSCVILGSIIASASTIVAIAQQQTTDTRELEEIERAWISAVDRPHDWAVAFFDRVLADDEVHILANGHRLSKADELSFIRQAPKEHSGVTPRPGRVSFEEMQVRLFGAIAIVNGTTVTHTVNGDLIRRVRFSDVFQKRSGRWQAINLQETLLEGLPRS